MKLRLVSAAALAAAVLSSAHLHAQSSPPLHAGQRIRLALPDTAFIGTVAGEVVEATPDSFTVQIHTWQRTLAYRDVRTLEVSEGRGPRPRSMAIGAAFGLLAGEGASLVDKAVQPHVKALVSNCADPVKCPPYYRDQRQPYPAGRGWAWRGAGTALGMAVAFIRPSDRWRRISLVAGQSAAAGTKLGIDLGL